MQIICQLILSKFEHLSGFDKEFHYFWPKNDNLSYFIEI